MITIEELKRRLPYNKPMAGQVSISALATLREFTNVRLRMDKSSYDYYYTLDVGKLLESKANDDCIKNLVDDGWSLSEDYKYIVKYLTN